MPEPRKLCVFLCHSSNDKPAVRELYQRLKGEGWIDPWLDEEKLLPGQDWDLEIEKAVEAADAVIIFLSNNSVSKEGYIQRELRFVLRIADFKPEGTVFVIPIRLNDCPIPRRLSMWQYVDYFPKNQGEKAYQRLLDSLKIRADLLRIVINDLKHESGHPELIDFLDTIKNDKPNSQTDKWYRSLVPLRVREGPAIDDKITFTLRQGEVVEKISATIDASWIKITKKDEDLVGWCQGQYLALVAGPPPKPSVQKSKNSKLNIRSFLFIGIFLIIIILWWLYSLRRNNLSSIPTPTFAQFSIGSSIVSEKDNMTLIYVPAGEFEMGSDDGEADEKPVHTVYLDAFWIDQTEVTNAMYTICVQARECNPPSSNKSYTHNSYYGNSIFDDYPVIYVSWNDAVAYCEWAGRRLPTEAEWEKAAGWDEEKRTKSVYPWGDSINCSLENYESCIGDTVSVGSYKNGQSHYGVYDMAGNVWEWVSDWYNENYYSVSPSFNPIGPNSGTYRVLRGGSWLNSADVTYTTYRTHNESLPSANAVGFRCALSASE